MDDAGTEDFGGDASSLGLDEEIVDDESLTAGGVGGKDGQSASLQVQSLLALQELGIVVAVALMVGIIFMLMIVFEKTCNCVTEFYQKRVGTYEEEDAEDPAALVGTFKRYKN